MDSYLTLAAGGEGRFTEKRSRFLSFARHVESEEEIKSHLEKLRKDYFDARHVCFAYVLGEAASVERAGDDGEPSGSAGRPILGQIRSRNLTDTLVAVVRYFGGVKLGTGGLFSAYKASAALALDDAEVEERLIKSCVRAWASFAETDLLMRIARSEGAEIEAQDYYMEGSWLTLRIRRSSEAALRARIAQVHTFRLESGNEE